MTPALDEQVVDLEALAPGSSAYVDADWIIRSSAHCAALIADATGIRWCNGPTIPMLEGKDHADAVAAAALEAVARAAAERVPEASLGAVDVLGTGLVAGEIRRLLRARGAAAPAGGKKRLRCCVDATGDPAVIQEALSGLDDLETMIVAGPLAGRTFTMDMYPDLHVRGLHLVGIGPPLSDGTTPSPTAGASAPPVACGPTGPFAGGTWFRIDA